MARIEKRTSSWAYVFPGNNAAVVVRALRRRRLATRRAVAGTVNDGCSLRVWSIRKHQLASDADSARAAMADSRRWVATAALVWKPTRMLLCQSERLHADRRARAQRLHQVAFDPPQSCSRMKQLVNHFPDSTPLTTKDGLLRTMIALYAERGAVAVKAMGSNAFIGAAAAERARIAGQLYALMPPTIVLPANNQRTLSANWRHFERWFARLEKRKRRREAAAGGLEAEAAGGSPSPLNMDSVFQSFPRAHMERNLWIVKPTRRNCGRGIEVFGSLREIKRFVSRDAGGLSSGGKRLVSHTASTVGSGSSDSYIIQKYIERPLLYQNRKFDIRIWCAVIEPFEAYIFTEGYLRTSSEQFTLDIGASGDDDRMVHLTNYCMQRTSQNLGKFEDGNTLSFADLARHLDERAQSQSAGDEGGSPPGSGGKEGGVFATHVWPQMQAAAADVFRAAFRHGDALGSRTAPSITGRTRTRVAKGRRSGKPTRTKMGRRASSGSKKIQHMKMSTSSFPSSSSSSSSSSGGAEETGDAGRSCFELYGLDFLIDEALSVWLIEVNENPYLGTQNKWHASLVERMVDSLVSLAVDPRLPSRAALRVEPVADSGAELGQGTFQKIFSAADEVGAVLAAKLAASITPMRRGAIADAAARRTPPEKMPPSPPMLLRTKVGSPRTSLSRKSCHAPKASASTGRAVNSFQVQGVALAPHRRVVAPRAASTTARGTIRSHNDRLRLQNAGSAGDHRVERTYGGGKGRERPNKNVVRRRQSRSKVKKGTTSSSVNAGKKTVVRKGNSSSSSSLSLSTRSRRRRVASKTTPTRATAMCKASLHARTERRAGRKMKLKIKPSLPPEATERIVVVQRPALSGPHPNVPQTPPMPPPPTPIAEEVAQPLVQPLAAPVQCAQIAPEILPSTPPPLCPPQISSDLVDWIAGHRSHLIELDDSARRVAECRRSIDALQRQLDDHRQCNKSLPGIVANV